MKPAKTAATGRLLLLLTFLPLILIGCNSTQNATEPARDTTPVDDQLPDDINNAFDSDNQGITGESTIDNDSSGTDTGADIGEDNNVSTEAQTDDNTSAETASDSRPQDDAVGSDLPPVDEIDHTSRHTGNLIPPDRLLRDLPDIPVTPAPGADSEPVPAEPFTGTVTDFILMRDPVRDLIDREGFLNDVDFAAGPLPPVISIPPNVDPLTNSPPFFAGLDNAEVFAGEELNVVFDPDDPDGGIPGMFGGNLPAGAQFTDNLDTTRSLRWRPLQPDVGIHEFTATAIDPLEPWYRSSQTIRIRVKLPEDQSGIVNLPPGIDRVGPHTVRVSDDVVVYIKVTDPNGDIPLLKILNPPAGATITPHPDTPAISILHFIPEMAGTVSLQLQAVDAADPALTARQTVDIEVLSDAQFERPGTRLRNLADRHGILFGYALLQNYYERPDGGIYAKIAAEEFDFVSTENSLKFDFLNPLPGQYRWAATDNMVKQAQLADQLIHGHTLVWHRQLPPWVKRSAIADRELIMREHIDRVLSRYADDIPIWDVVNESLEDDGSFRNSVWFEAMGASYIDIALRQARASAPDITLIYNDYDIGFAGPKFDGLMSLLNQLKQAGTPLDGVGFQLHLMADFDKVAEVAENFQAVADLDLDIYVTEFDVSIADGQTLTQQARLYEQVLSACLEQVRCKAFQTWGFTDQYSWRGHLDPLILDRRYQVKPAYLALQQRLGEPPLNH